MKTKALSILILVAAAIFMAGCVKTNTGYTPIPNTTVHTGVMLAMTGGGYSTGETSSISVRMAQADLQSYLAGLGMHVQVVMDLVDTKTDTAEALKQLSILYDKGIRLVIGPYSSAEVAACKRFADEHGILLVSPSSVAISLAIPNDNIYRFVSTDVIQGEAMTKLLVADSIKAIVPLVRNDVWGRDLMNAVKFDFEAAGKVVHSPVLFQPGATSVDPYLAVLDANVAYEKGIYGRDRVAVYMVSLAEGSAFLARAGSFQSLAEVVWYGSSGFAQNAAALSDTVAAHFARTHGFTCPIYGLEEAAKYKWERIVTTIQMETGRTPDIYAITAYDALWTGVMTLLQTGANPSIDRLRYAFTQEAGNYFGASGATNLDVNGDRAAGNYDFWSMSFSGGKYSWIRTARYNSATGILIRY